MREKYFLLMSYGTLIASFFMPAPASTITFIFGMILVLLSTLTYMARVRAELHARRMSKLVEEVKKLVSKRPEDAGEVQVLGEDRSNGVRRVRRG